MWLDKKIDKQCKYQSNKSCEQHVLGNISLGFSHIWSRPTVLLHYFCLFSYTTHRTSVDTSRKMADKLIQQIYEDQCLPKMVCLNKVFKPTLSPEQFFKNNLL